MIRITKQELISAIKENFPSNFDSIFTNFERSLYVLRNNLQKSLEPIESSDTTIKKNLNIFLISLTNSLVIQKLITMETEINKLEAQIKSNEEIISGIKKALKVDTDDINPYLINARIKLEKEISETKNSIQFLKEQTNKIDERGINAFFGEQSEDPLDITSLLEEEFEFSEEVLAEFRPSSETTENSNLF